MSTIVNRNCRRCLVAAAVAACLALRASAAEPQWIEVTADRAAVKSGNADIGFVRRGETYQVTETAGEWYGITINAGGAQKGGWIAAQFVRPVAPPVAPKPPAWVQVVAETASVLVGDELIGKARRGQVLKIVKGEAPWFYVEFRADGKLIEGYVHQSEAQVADESLVGPGMGGYAPFAISAATMQLDENRERLTLTVVVPRRDSDAKLRLAIPEETSAALRPLELTQDGDQVTLQGTVEQLIAATTPGTRSLWLLESSADEVSAAGPANVFVAAAVEVSPPKSVNGGAPVKATFTNNSGSPVEVIWIDQQGDEVSYGTLADGQSREQSSFAKHSWVFKVGGRRIAQFVADDDERQEFIVKAPAVEPLAAAPAVAAADSAVAHRVDLPTVEIGVAVQTQQYAEFTEGLVLMIPATGLWPGFTVETGLPGEPLRPAPREVGGMPRFLDVYKPAQQEFVRLSIPFNDNRGLNIRVRNPDGSRSQTIAVTRRGTRVDRAATVVAPPLAALVDSTVAVPDLALIDVGQASAAVRGAGLVPRVVDAATLQPRESFGGLVLRQAVAAEGRLPLGSELLLVVEDDLAADAVWNESAPDPIPSVLERGFWGDLSDLPVAHLGVVDAADALNLVGIVADAQATANPAGGDDAPTALDDTALGTTISGGGLIGYDDQSAGGINFDGAGNAAAEAFDGAQNRGAVLALGTRPGLNIDPTADAGRKQAAVTLKLVLDAIFNQPSSQGLPGPVGAAIGGAIRRHEQKLLDAIADGQASWADEPVSEEILELVVEQLQLDLSLNEKNQAVADWRGYARVRPHPVLIDVNRNGRTADDVVAWYLHWLFEHGKFDPSTIAVVKPGPGGKPLAVIPPTVQPGGGSGGNGPSVVNPEQPGVLDVTTTTIVKPGNTGDKPPIEPAKPEPPTADAVFALHSTPDRVRVPLLEGDVVSGAHRELADLGLKIENPDDYFASDKIVNQGPGPRVWVDEGSEVGISVIRRVPNLVQMSLDGANQRLAQLKMMSNTEGKTAGNDIVTGQEPEAGAFISPSTPVELELSILIPHVVGKNQGAAADFLANCDLGWRADSDKTFQEDRVAAQRPSAGTIASRGDEVTLTLHLPVPSVLGQSLADARQSMESWDLVPVVPNNFAHNEDVVRGQVPKAGTYVAHQSSATLDPVKGIVPDLRGGTIGDAVAKLQNVEDYQAATIGQLLDGDVVTGQEPRPGSEYERGQTVTLDARVEVPNVARRNIIQGRDIIAQADGNLRPIIDGDAADSDVVYSQSPRGGEIAFPRTDVVLVPGVYVPNLRGLSPNQVDGELRAVNLNGRIVSSSTTETANRAEVGRVVIAGQNPGAGLFRRRDVDLVRLEATEFILAVRPVPNVNRDTVSVAIQLIRQAGLNVRIENDGQFYSPAEYMALPIEERTYSSQGNIVENIVGVSDPPAGTPLVVGDTVTISVIIFR